MDFRQITQPASGRPAPAAPTQSPPERQEGKRVDMGREKLGWLQIFNGVLLVGIALLIGLVALAVTRVTSTNEGKFVSTNKYQAVFLNNGQVYFGNITSLNNQYVRMSNIYYLTQSAASSSSSSSSSSNYSLVKLGCQQIHDPYDAMVINRDQITFWENLQDSGKVVTSIKQFIKQNPNGPDCSQVSAQTQASNSTTQGTTGGNTSNTNTSTNTTK
ncbi:MAG TPA: hypothetical protein VLG92_01270 [Candidatus Saccharimonadia bacterium]|nr:hypothetical protein [Candidatus Saccharimonadia bacterium]